MGPFQKGKVPAMFSVPSPRKIWEKKTPAKAKTASAGEMADSGLQEQRNALRREVGIGQGKTDTGDQSSMTASSSGGTRQGKAFIEDYVQSISTSFQSTLAAVRGDRVERFLTNLDMDMDPMEISEAAEKEYTTAIADYSKTDEMQRRYRHRTVERVRGTGKRIEYEMVGRKIWAWYEGWRKDDSTSTSIRIPSTGQFRAISRLRIDMVMAEVKIFMTEWCLKRGDRCYLLKVIRFSFGFLCDWIRDAEAAFMSAGCPTLSVGDSCRQTSCHEACPRPTR